MDEDLVKSQITRGTGITGYGRSLVRLGLRAQRMQSALTMVQWGGPDTDGRGPCPACSRFEAQGHDGGCFIAEALRERDPITHAEDAIRFVRDLVRRQQDSVETHAAMIRITLDELKTTLADVGDILERL